jgi:GT2 family glycosyltransferase
VVVAEDNGKSGLTMKLSIVILCWNDIKVVGDCLKSIYETTRSTDFEVIVSDNGSTDGTIEYIRQNYPQVHLIENGVNLRFAKGIMSGSGWRRATTS